MTGPWGNWIAGVGCGALFAQLTPSLPPWARVSLGAVTVVCFLATWRRVGRGAQNLAKTFASYLKVHWPLFVILALIVLMGGIILRVSPFPSPSLPEDVLEARRDVLGVLRAREEAEPLTVMRSDGTGSEIWYAEGFKVIMIEPSAARGNIFKIYIKDGKRIAEDLWGHAPHTFERRYYRVNCNFATDHFYSSGVYAFLEYKDGCSGGPSRIFEPETPVLPVPVFSYR